MTCICEVRIKENIGELRTSVHCGKCETFQRFHLSPSCHLLASVKINQYDSNAARHVLIDAGKPLRYK